MQTFLTFFSKKYNQTWFYRLKKTLQILETDHWIRCGSEEILFDIFSHLKVCCDRQEHLSEVEPSLTRVFLWKNKRIEIVS